jgi:hypothetical protein
MADRNLVVVDDRAAAMIPPTPTMPKSCSSAARRAPMLPAPKTWMPSDKAQRISL